MSRRLRTDTRAIDGGAIRLVVALAVTVAATSLVTTPLDAIQNVESDDEVTVRPSESVVTLSDDETVVTLSVLTEDGRPVPDSAVLVKSESVPLEDGPSVHRTGPDSNQVTLTLSTAPDGDLHPVFRPRQSRGALELEVVSLAGSEYTDEKANPDLTVIDG